MNDELELNINDREVRFFLLGDWGGVKFYPHKTLVQELIAFAMEMRAQKMKTHFQLGLGDNFYKLGVQSVNDSRFQVALIDMPVKKVEFFI